jgi:hypothetical protein
MPITYLLEKDDIKAEPILLNLKMFQSIYPYLFTLLLTDNFREWYLANSDPSHIEEFTQIFDRCQHTVVRCYTTKMVTTFMLFPQTIPQPLVRTKSFDIPTEISTRVSESRNISPQIKVTNYSMGGGIYFPDHTFLTIETDPSRIILIQSFYECYNVNSKYGIQILEGDEMIREFSSLMNDLEESSRMELDLDVFTARMELATRLSKFTGIDLSRHPTFLKNQSLSSYFYKSEIILPYEAYSKNICTKISSILKFMTDTIDFKRTTDLFMAPGNDQIANRKYTLYDAFIEPNVFDVENSNNIERFIFYTGYSTMYRIEKKPIQEGDFTFDTYDVYYYDWIDIPVLMTGVLYLIYGFGCSELLQHAYGPSLIRYVNHVGIDHKVLYKHVIAISKMVYESIQPDRMVTPLYLTLMLQEVEKRYKSIISFENVEIRIEPFFTRGLVLTQEENDSPGISGYKMALITAEDEGGELRQKIKKSLISFLVGDRDDTFFEDNVTITASYKPVIDSIHEAFVHLRIVNKMCDESKNLSFMYSYVDCSPDLGRCIEMGEECKECKSYGIYEKINGTPLTALTNLALLRDILLQVFGTLAVLHHKCKYIHHLLHTNYIMVETQPTETTYYYPMNGDTHEIKTNVRAVITNHQYATFMDENGYEWQSSISADFRPATDIFPILKNLYHQTRQLGDVDNERMVVRVMTHFFGDIETYLQESSSLLLYDWDEAVGKKESFTAFGYEEVFEYIFELSR